jgi:hypothetical protein
MHVPETAQTGRDAHSGYLPRPSDTRPQERAITAKAQCNSTDVRTPDAKKQRRIRRPLQDLSEAGVNARPRLGSNETTTKDPLYSGRFFRSRRTYDGTDCEVQVGLISAQHKTSQSQPVELVNANSIRSSRHYRSSIREVRI